MIDLNSIFENPFARKALDQVELPNYFTDNLKYDLRPYQIEAFKRFIHLDTEDFDGKPGSPLHLLFNMATGSGKTLVMAGLMLYLYDQGYRNFLFFVNSNNIIQKTKDNFLNAFASKYLFKEKIIIRDKEVFIKEVENFDEADKENINIKFTTIQQLHIDLNNTKENSVTYEDFENRELVLIADEAHHLVAGTKSGNLLGSWEDTVKKIHNSNFSNILLEFTATIDTKTAQLLTHYKDKVIYKYDLAQFRLDKYSKEINLVRTDYDQRDRILQALLLNLYRQELATSNGINLKPVILFKAKRTIKESEDNKLAFHQLIDALSVPMIEHVRKTSTIPVVAQAFRFFDSKGISLSAIVGRLQSNFRFENCLSANNDSEAEQNQIMLNTLEDENNPIRAIFAVQKLNEGWDVLNLFDIVRLYEGRDGRAGNPGRTTIAEAQLIGRGARYFPFSLSAEQDKFKRKYDNDLDNDLKILEELYYHTKEDSRYISELKQALIDSGIYEDEDDLETKQLSLKLEFKETDLYNSGQVVFNKRIPKDYSGIRSFKDLGVNRTNVTYTLSSGAGRISSAFFELESTKSNDEVLRTKEIQISDIPVNIIQYALSENPFFYFDALNRYFPAVSSLSDFVRSEDYLGGLAINFKGNSKRLEKVTHFDYLQGVRAMLRAIEAEIKSNVSDYEGSPYIYDYINKVFTDKQIRVNKNDERADGQEDLVLREPWFAYNANYGTSEEKKFIELFSRKFESLQQKFDDIHIIRNERALAIYDKQGRRFEPDFLLFCSHKNDRVTYQVFIEPKGKHLMSFDKWKEDFLKEIASEKKLIKIFSDNYLLTAAPFYNYSNENEFGRKLKEVLE